MLEKLKEGIVKDKNKIYEQSKHTNKEMKIMKRSYKRNSGVEKYN